MSTYTTVVQAFRLRASRLLAAAAIPTPIVSTYLGKPTASVTDWGVVDDPTGAAVSANTAALIKAIKECAGNHQLIIPAGMTIVTTPMVWTGDYSDIVISGVIKLAPNSAADLSVRGNLIDLQMSNFRIEFTTTGYLDGNRSNQAWADGQVVGGLTANAYSTSGVQLVDPGSSAVNISNGIIINPQIKNVGNWPISLGYCTNVKIFGGKLKDSGNSPQFFSGSSGCSIVNCYMENITDAGFSLYVGNTGNSVVGCRVNMCNQGIGAYVEDDTRALVSDCVIRDNFISNCKNGAIGFTTGGSVTTPKIQNCVAFNNTCVNNCASPTNTSAVLGAVGTKNITYENNVVVGGGALQTTTALGFYSDPTTDGLTLIGNRFSDIGSIGVLGYGVDIDGSTNTLIDGNMVTDKLGVMSKAFTGTLGSGSWYGTNHTVSFTGTKNDMSQ